MSIECSSFVLAMCYEFQKLKLERTARKKCLNSDVHIYSIRLKNQ